MGRIWSNIEYRRADWLSLSPVEQRQVHLFVHLLERRLHHHHALPLLRLPDARQVVDALAPLVDEQRRRLRARGRVDANCPGWGGGYVVVCVRAHVLALGPDR